MLMQHIPSFLYVARALWRNQSVLRAYLNYRLEQDSFGGVVLDIGGGHGEGYLPKKLHTTGTTFITIDQKSGSVIDFEKDSLPYGTHTQETILFLNVLEHIYNHTHIATELVRVLKPGGRIVGYVPFLMWYHEDPHDFFRYTHEALERIFCAAGATEISIEPLSGGPGTAAAHMFIQSTPRFLRPLLYAPWHCFDCLFRILRPSRVSVFALGYYFTVRKNH